MQVQAKPGLKLIAILEAMKGLLSFSVALGLHLLAGKDLQQWAESLVLHAHLNPAHHLPGVFIEAMGRFPQGNVQWFMLGTLAYTIIRWVEAYGLWKGLRWTEWLALIGCVIYVPFEVYGLIHHPGIIGAVILIVNLLIIAYIARTLQAKPEFAIES
ncbi:hypothetical protein BA953_00335 [Vibrio coralliilyticus]|uniref:DUF2127 domain-containing protein n=1 Tax=Vibrio coralliilyticus TaxID=190893 RepID=UPI000810B716|nr:DUF2127 domain-containing protein [Vibrio coralliilyticus]ANW22772.1 hypothetical protein BA953_00335 [Vibrio coralliilyticus]